jgi:hypothetical protein
MVYLDSDAGLGIIPGTTGNVDPGSAFPIAGDSGAATGTGAGRYGFRLAGVGGFVGNAFTSIWNWLNKPFTTPMAPTDIFLLIGVIIFAMLLWNLILYHIRIAGEAL